MIMKSQITKFLLGVRKLHAVPSPKAIPVFPLAITSEEGYRLSCIAEPALATGISRFTLVFNAGSRQEVESEDHGLSHFIQRGFGLSTSKYTAVNLTRHFQQMGARLTCTVSREHMIYAVDVAPNLIPRAGSLLAEMATDSAFYHWELKSTAYKLMYKDIELLNRRNLPALTMELLHEAAYGKNSSGCGLGNSILASKDRVGTHSIEQVEQFFKRFFIPSNCALSLIGCDTNEEGMELLKSIKLDLHSRAPQTFPEKTGKVHCFVGGDVRRDLAAATRVYASLAWPTHGQGCPLRPAFDLAACLLTGAMGHVSYSDRVNTFFGDDTLASEGVQAAAFTKVYSDHGLFGVSICGSNAKTISDQLIHVLANLRKVKFTEEDLARAKTLYKANLLMEFESPLTIGTDLAVQLSFPQGHYRSPTERAAAVDAITLAQFNEVVSKSVSSTSPALSVVGLGAYDVLPLSTLLSA